MLHIPLTRQELLDDSSNVVPTTSRHVDEKGMRGSAAAVRADLASRLAKCREVLSSVASSTKALASAPAIYADAVQPRAPAEPKRRHRVAPRRAAATSSSSAAKVEAFERYMQRPRESAESGAAADDFEALRARAAAASARVASVRTRLATTKEAIAARAAAAVQRPQSPAGAAQRAAPPRRRARDYRSGARLRRRASGGGKRGANEGAACTQYNRYGRCDRGRACKYVHDATQVAVCRAFIAGVCSDALCLLTHELQRSKMPVCRHFLRGTCALPLAECPYLHVKLGSTGERERKKRRVRGGGEGGSGARPPAERGAKSRGADDAPPPPPPHRGFALDPPLLHPQRGGGECAVTRGSMQALRV